MNLCDRNEIHALLERHGFRFTKALGQNFLIEDWVPQDTVSVSGIDEDTGVLEIGPGIGSLTKELCKTAGKVAAVELDYRLPPILQETLADFDNFTLVQGDVMKLDLAALVSEQFPNLKPVLCANLPYNITTPLLTKCLRDRCFESLTVLIQKEVALRICAKPGNSDYGAFTLLMQYYSEPEFCFEVPRTCFMPAPKVTSAVIHCPVRQAPPVEVCSEAFFFKTVRAGFALRRKTLVNSLGTAFGKELCKGELTDILSACGLPADIRGERLGLAEYALLANRLNDALTEKAQ
jgi:16S rRNA (adenine1518-N6/adenine1519-N6)-dimethyltransferase